MRTKVIIDFHPLVYALYASVAPLTTHESFKALDSAKKSEVLHSICDMNVKLITSLAFMGDKRPDDYQIIFVTDKKESGKYWRHSYLTSDSIVEQRQALIDADYEAKVSHIDSERAAGVKGLRKPSKPKIAEPIAYKGGRKQVSELHLNLVHMLKKAVIEAGYTILGITGYEADDLAAALVRLNAGRSYSWLLTIDTDWLGLVNDSVGWCCQKGYDPRFRDSMVQVNEWSSRRLRKTFEVAREIWDYKATVGDKSDNLPAFSPLEVIDLNQPPDEFNLLKQPKYAEHLEKVLQADHNDAHFDFDGTSSKLAAIGLTPIIPHLF